MRRRAAAFRFRELTLVPAIVLAIIAGAFISPAFLTTDNFLNVLQQSSELSVLVIAQSLILIAGKFDLSLESTVGLAPMTAAWLMATDTTFGGSGFGLNVYPAILILFAIGAVVGFVNGFLVVRLRLNAFIVTLAMLILLRGVTLGVTNGKTLFDLPPEFLYLGTAKWLGAPISIWVAAVLYLIFGLFLRYHRTGRALYAIGGNAEAARVAGIRVERITWGVYVVGGLLAALAGLMLTGRIASVVSSQGQNMIFYVFAAAVIGGISLNGGRGRLLGALTGVLLLGFLQNILTLAQVPAFWIDAAYGAIILVSLILARITAGGVREA
ncbi:MAG: ABC transporter permease [Methylobacteriaceae bacterium]|nr:ABC transporter permease [Methylobacteriaceae bacterium]